MCVFPIKEVLQAPFSWSLKILTPSVICLWYCRFPGAAIGCPAVFLFSAVPRCLEYTGSCRHSEMEKIETCPSDGTPKSQNIRKTLLLSLFPLTVKQLSYILLCVPYNVLFGPAVSHLVVPRPLYQFSALRQVREKPVLWAALPPQAGILDECFKSFPSLGKSGSWGFSPTHSTLSLG